MDEREDSKILRRRDEEHVSIFKARAGMGAVIMEGQEIGAVVRYIEALERDATRRTTPDREASVSPAQWQQLVEASQKVAESAQRRAERARDMAIEECAKVCDEYAIDRFALFKGRKPYTGREQGRADPYYDGASDGADRCAQLIRELKTTTATSPRDTLIEEIAEMVDHMGEGRRLEEYVGAIREMKSGDKGGA